MIRFRRPMFKISREAISIRVPVPIERNTVKSIPDFDMEFENAIKLNVGGGKNHPQMDDWTVVDIRSHADVVVDISKEPLPYKDNSADIIFTSHTLEHIFPQRLPFVLKEFRRVLKDDKSLLRIIVPDITKAIKAYVNNDITFFENSQLSSISKGAPIGGELAAWFYSTRLDKDTGELSDMLGHVHCFDFEYLSWHLRQAGFSDIYRSAYGQSCAPELRRQGFDRYPNESIFLECINH